MQTPLSSEGLTTPPFTQQDWIFEPDHSAVDCALGADYKPIVLWGIVPNAPFHIGYDKTALALTALTERDARVSVLLADLHTIMAHGRTFSQSQERARYYQIIFKHCYGISADYVYGSSFQTSQTYVSLLLQALHATTVGEVKKALPKAVTDAQNTEPKRISTYVYILMQVVDPIYLSADLIFGDAGQRSTYKLSDGLYKRLYREGSIADIGRKPIGEILYPPRVYMHLPHDLKGQPLSASSHKTRVSLHECPDQLWEKIKGAYAPPQQETTDDGKVNALLELYQYSVFPWSADPIQIRTESGGDKDYNSFSELRTDYLAGVIHPKDAKKSLFIYLDARLHSMRERLREAIYAWIE